MRPNDAGWGVDERAALFFANSESEPVRLARERGCYQRYYDGVASAIEGGATSPVTAVDALRCQYIVDLVMQSATQGRRLDCKK